MFFFNFKFIIIIIITESGITLWLVFCLCLISRLFKILCCIKSGLEIDVIYLVSVWATGGWCSLDMECSSKAHELSLGPQLHTVVKWQKLSEEPRKMKEVGLMRACSGKVGCCPSPASWLLWGKHLVSLNSWPLPSCTTLPLSKGSGVPKTSGKILSQDLFSL